MDKEFLKRLLATFQIEAEEHLKTITTGLIKFEKCDDEIEKIKIIEPVYRAAHSLKGAARAVSLMEIERLCQNIENVFAAFKKQELKESFNLFDHLHKGVDLISSFLSSNNEDHKYEIANEIENIINILNEHIVVDYQEPPETAFPDVSPKISSDDLEKPVEKKEVKSETHDVKPPKNNNGATPAKSITTNSIPPTDTVRISTSKLDSLHLQGEEMLSTKLFSEELTRNINKLENYFENWKREIEKVNVHLRNLKAASLINEIGEISTDSEDPVIRNFIDWNQSYLKELNEEIRTLAKYSQNNSYTLGRMINRLIVDLKEILLLPFSHLLDLFPKLVRDISRDIGKKIELEILGSDIMIDRRILEEMKDPLIHIVRNSIDHGIEYSEKRKEIGKNPNGKISIIIEPAEGNKIKICIKDDGKGIDLEQIKQSAIRQDFATETGISKLTQHEIISLIFHSGISTSKKVTDISGRGLGMAIVKEKVEKLGGSIKIDTTPGAGTSFSIYLPLTLTTFRGIVLGCSGKLYVIQTIHVRNVIRIKASDIKTIESKETITIDEIPVSLVFLSEILGIEGRKEYSDNEYLTVVIIAASNKNIAFAVDEIIHEQEILLKQFNYQLVKIKNIAGATILGNGKVVPLLDINDLIKSAEKPTKQIIKKPILAEEKRNILVVDDSITSRTLLKDILESAGYNITLCVDGLDALTTLKSKPFDLVVSDIEMPRMNGFELTVEIRKNQKLSNIPLVLVTALAKQEDREKGMDVGADAYMVKSSFDQSDLLSIIKRLI